MLLKSTLRLYLFVKMKLIFFYNLSTFFCCFFPWLSMEHSKLFCLIWNLKINLKKGFQKWNPLGNHEIALHCFTNNQHTQTIHNTNQNPIQKRAISLNIIQVKVVEKRWLLNYDRKRCKFHVVRDKTDSTRTGCYGNKPMFDHWS